MARFRVAGSSDDFRAGFTEDLSPNGLFIQTTAGLGRGTRIEIELETPAGPLRLLGRVKWAKRAPLALAQKKRSGMGIELDEMPGPVRQMLAGAPPGATGR
jgi:hypothetical protein